MDMNSLSYSIRQKVIEYKQDLIPEETFDLLGQVQGLEINLEAANHKIKILQGELEDKFKPN